MKINEAKDKLAQAWGLKHFEELKSQGRPCLENFYDKVADLYAEAKVSDFKSSLRKEIEERKQCDRFENIKLDQIRDEVFDEILTLLDTCVPDSKGGIKIIWR